MNKKKLSIIIVVITFVLIIAWVLYSLNEFNDDKNDYAPTDSDASEPIGTLMYTSDEADYPTFSVYRINKIAGTSYSWDSEDGISVKNNKYLEVAGTDLGAITKCGDKFYLNFGDTLLENITYTGTNPNFPANQAENNFFVAFSNSTNIEDLTFDGYIASGDRPSRALLNCHNVGSGGEGGCYTIPNAMFSVLDSNGQCVGLFSQYMDVNTVGGHNHKSYASYIAKMDWNDSGLFKDYKGNDYKWSIAGAPNERYDFTMASFVQKGDYIYMFGSPAGRFGGLKVARIETSKFLNTTDLDGWEYFTNDNQWVRSKDLNFIKNSAKWVISPKDSNYTYFKNYADGQEAIQNMTIAEFSVVYNEYLSKYVLITGRPDSTLGVYMYLSDQPEGPWEEKILMPNKSRSPKSGTWTYYGTYTTSSLLQDNGKIMYFLATTWQPYGVYLYRVNFIEESPTCHADCANRECGTDGCEGSCGTCTGGKICNDVGQCVTECTPSCDGKQCGDDTCGGSCGTCTGGKTCNDVGQCVETGGVCTPSCANKCGGTDGCSGTCPNNCIEGQTCDVVTNQCVTTETVATGCTPSCTAEEICVLNTHKCVVKGETDIDLNDDNKLSLSDYVRFVNDYKSYKGGGVLSESSDFNGDGKISLSDYTIFVREYLRLKKL